MRTFEELVATDDPAWPLLQQTLAEASNIAVVLPPNDSARQETLVALQVTLRSVLGAVAFETGGLLIDDGWLRILGSGCPRLPRALPAWNKAPFWPGGQAASGCLLVADDVVGGLFAINAGAFDGPNGNVFYFAPDTLGWEDLERGYSDFVDWALNGDLATFYETFRWPDWRAEVAQMSGDDAVSVVPFLWSDGPPVGQRSRRVVPMLELVGMQFDILGQMNA